MSYDLYAWPVDRAMPIDEAMREIEGRARRWKLGIRRDRRIDRFASAMEEAIPGLGTMRSEVPMEFDVGSDYVHMALPWSMVAELVELIAPIAYGAGLALYDPQRVEVAFPAPFGEAPLGTRGIDQHEAVAQSAFAAIMGAGDPNLGANAALWAAGFTAMSPLGFEITPDLEAEVLANPNRVPTSLQTPSHKAELLGELRGRDAEARDRARRMLGGWDPDPEVHEALLDELASEDVFAVGNAAMALARLGDPADLPAVIEAVRRMSPSDGGTMESMWMPLTGALELARKVGPAAVEDLKAQARSWRHVPDGARRGRAMADPEFEQWLDALSTGVPSVS